MAKLVVAIVALTLSTAAFADESLQTLLDRALEKARARHGIPAIAALVQIDGRPEAMTAIGVRVQGRAERVAAEDLWHIGSDTKAFTAALVMRLAEQGVVALNDTLAASLPSLAREMNAAYRDVTIGELLSHTAGLPTLTGPRDLPPFERAIASEKDITAQRLAIARTYLARAPAGKRGEFRYSNLGYIIAGAILEARTGRPWEDLMRAEVFVPLGIAHAGFGPPGTPGTRDEPRGHRAWWIGFLPFEPSDPHADNRPALGPAGTIHISLRDWMLFAQDQVDGARGHGKLLTAASYRAMQTPVAANYAMGWGVALGADGLPNVLAHTGSNGYWLAYIRLLPRRNAALLIVMNAGNAAANEALDDIMKVLGPALR